MTERFTGKVSDRNIVSNGIYGMIEKCGRYFVGEAIDKLAEYETAEEEGRLVVLPCKVGEKIYAIYTGSTGKNPTIMRTSFDYGLIPYFGKSVFLSYEEAEKALEEMRFE